MFGSISAKSTTNAFAERPLASDYVAYSADGILDKPVIVVEGYDPSNSVFPNYYYNYGFKQLVNNGRDLIVVNFPNGSASLNENTSLLQDIILEINAAKTGSYPTAVIGYSMGGIVARKALKNMELAGIDHNTSLYVSYDAPHLGANIPVELQRTIEGLISKLDGAAAGYTASNLKRARNVYNSPAAREMLIAGPDYTGASATDFPNNLTRVAVTSGSLLGVFAMQDNSTFGKNLIHHPINEYFNYSQLMQLNCALDAYQVVGAPIPDRSFKQY